jgi:hypothetical protein
MPATSVRRSMPNDVVFRSIAPPLPNPRPAHENQAYCPTASIQDHQ